MNTKASVPPPEHARPAAPPPPPPPKSGCSGTVINDLKAENAALKLHLANAYRRMAELEYEIRQTVERDVPPGERASSDEYETAVLKTLEACGKLTFPWLELRVFLALPNMPIGYGTHVRAAVWRLAREKKVVVHRNLEVSLP